MIAAIFCSFNFSFVFVVLPFQVRFEYSSFVVSMWRAQVAVNVTQKDKLKQQQEEIDDWDTDPDFIVGFSNCY